jgi:hypothetical protein
MKAKADTLKAIKDNGGMILNADYPHCVDCMALTLDFTKDKAVTGMTRCTIWKTLKTPYSNICSNYDPKVSEV